MIMPFQSWIINTCVRTFHSDRGIALSMKGMGAEVILPMIGLRGYRVPSFSLQKLKRCNRLLNTTKSSIFASGSPKHVRGPKNK